MGSASAHLAESRPGETNNISRTSACYGFDYIIAEPIPTNLDATYPSPSRLRNTHEFAPNRHGVDNSEASPTKERGQNPWTGGNAAFIPPASVCLNELAGHRESSSAQEADGMTGRRARLGATASPAPTFATDRHIKWTKEAQILHPVDKKLPDSDWPVFTLRNVTVWNRAGTAYDDLLYVEKHGPFIVHGRLIVDHEDENQLSALVKRNQREVDVEIVAFRMSIGWGDGPTLWAASDYGFFLISHTVPEYQAVFAKTTEAIELYYLVMLTYEDLQDKAKGQWRTKKSFLDVPLEDILLKYAVSLGATSLTIEEAEERCKEHANFIAPHCLSEEDFEDWRGTRFYKWIHSLADKHRPRRTYPVQQPEEEPRTRGVSSAPSTASSLPQKNRGRSSSTMLAERKGSAAAHVQSAPSPALAPSPAPAPASLQGSEQATEGSSATSVVKNGVAATLYRTMIDLLEENKLPLHKISVAGMRTRIYMGCRFKNYEAPREMLLYFAKDLLSWMNSDARRAEGWKASKMYRELQSHVSVPVPLQNIDPALFAYSLERRRKAPTASARPSMEPGRPSQDARSEGAAAHADGLGTEGERSDTSLLLDRSRRGRPSGKVAGLRLATASGKKRPADSDAATSSSRVAKMAKRGGRGSDDEQVAHSNVDEQSDNSESVPSDGESDQELVHAAIYSDPLPSKKPDQNGIWTCAEEDCHHVIYNADEHAGQEAVDEHVYSHRDQVDAINLARVEGKGAHLPYSHLMEKLIAFGARKVAQQQAEDQDRPMPIRRALQ